MSNDMGLYSLEELYNFSARFQSFNKEMDELLKGMDAQMKTLGDNWHDTHYTEFYEQWAHASIPLIRYIQTEGPMLESELIQRIEKAVNWQG